MSKVEIKYVVDVVALFLGDGPKPFDEVTTHCARLGITRMELRAARKELNIKTVNTGYTWLWSVPESNGDSDA